MASPSQLDYESTPKLELIVAAAAGGSQAYAKVQVDLRDENDNDPKFAQTEYVSALWENNQPQTTVTQVSTAWCGLCCGGCRWYCGAADGDRPPSLR